LVLGGALETNGPAESDVVAARTTLVHEDVVEVTLSVYLGNHLLSQEGQSMPQGTLVLPYVRQLRLALLVYEPTGLVVRLKLRLALGCVLAAVLAIGTLEVEMVAVDGLDLEY
jgi:hypothetical protein